ncbi:hypothetical protein DSO57_1039100 [Entomophthora muscae]|uniref:Uncharacterized protein n=1 Tax=Entomophthora muscae TaxID=34485 RepID=A0ACC2RDA8_9FUNG|nr:hypothetical protein DSO57_1039100 [Entomophthora muscae]
MIAPIFKFVVFTLAPIFLLIWSTTPDFWDHLSLSASYVGENPFHLLLFLGDLPGQAHGLAVAGGKVVKSLTINNLELPLPISELEVSPKISFSKCQGILP